MLNMGSRWRPPRKRNERAWKKIEREAYLWDDKSLARGNYREWELDKIRASKQFKQRNRKINTNPNKPGPIGPRRWGH